MSKPNTTNLRFKLENNNNNDKIDLNLNTKEQSTNTNKYNNIYSNSITNSDEENNTSEENKNISNNSNNSNNSNHVIDSHKIEEYKNIIKELENEIQNEKNIIKNKKEENKNLITEYREDILKYKKEIRNCALRNEKQRKELYLMSDIISKTISNMKVSKITQNLEMKRKLTGSKVEIYENEKKVIDINIDIKEKQLKNIITLIKNYENQNEKLRYTINKSQNDNIDELLININLQEKEIIELNKKIKHIKMQLAEHEKCPTIKSEIAKKIEQVRNEIKAFKKKNQESKNKLTILESKKNKPKILLESYNNSKINSRNNKSMNLKYLGIYNTEINNMNRKMYQIRKNRLTIDNMLLNIKNKNQNQFHTQKRINTENKEEEYNDIPYDMSDIFTKKELKAIFFGFDKNKENYQNALKKFKVQSLFIESMEAKHKLSLKHKLNKINELDEQIQNMNIKNDETENNIELYLNQIDELKEENKLYLLKNNKLNIKIDERKKINERKDKEINILSYQLKKLRKLLKTGDFKSIKNEPEVEIQYIEEDETNDLDKNMTKYDKNNMTTQTEKTKFEEENEKNIKNINIKKSKIPNYNSNQKKNNKNNNYNSKSNIISNSNSNSKSESNSNSSSNSKSESNSNNN